MRMIIVCRQPPPISLPARIHWRLTVVHASSVQVDGSDGQKFEIVVPAGVTEGQTFKVQLPDAGPVAAEPVPVSKEQPQLKLPPRPELQQQTTPVGMPVVAAGMPAVPSPAPAPAPPQPAYYPPQAHSPYPPPPPQPPAYYYPPPQPQPQPVAPAAPNLNNIVVMNNNNNNNNNGGGGGKSTTVVTSTEK
eukprot:scaffold10395_cov133-Isochrysis_galbana.AAC.1